MFVCRTRTRRELIMFGEFSQHLNISHHTPLKKVETSSALQRSYRNPCATSFHDLQKFLWSVVGASVDSSPTAKCTFSIGYPITFPGRFRARAASVIHCAIWSLNLVIPLEAWSFRPLPHKDSRLLRPAPSPGGWPSCYLLISSLHAYCLICRGLFL